jgi:hypothetical protein
MRMIEVIRYIDPLKLEYSSSTTEYMKKAGITFPPEDVYFTKNMEDYDIGLLADRESAMKFSTESVKYDDSLGGHSFWYSDNNWVQRMFNYNFIYSNINAITIYVEPKNKTFSSNRTILNLCMDG